MPLEIKGITKAFAETKALDNVSFTVKRGSAFGLLGRNGAGKTTTIRIIMNFFTADSGEVFFDGVSNKETKLKIGYLPEERGLYPKRKVIDQLVYIGELKGMNKHDAKKRADYLLGRLDATAYSGRALETLSKGNQQKIQIATALITDPDILILDEPFSGLDPINSQTLKDLVRESVNDGKYVIFSSHQMAQVEQFCDDICILNFGKVVLSGHLKTIKRAYPRTRVFISLEKEDASVMQCIDKLGLANIIKESKATMAGTELTLFNDADRGKILGAFIQAKEPIASFSVIEPSLEEIFVEKAGEKQ